MRPTAKSIGTLTEYRKFSGTRLVVASHNPGKVREIKALLADFGVEPVSAGDLGLPEPVEDGDSFIANAEIKALAAATASGQVSLSDDSGFSVDILNGDPGIYSARWAGPSKDFAIAMQAVEENIQEKSASGDTQRRAAFICALTLAWPDGHRESFEGRVEGMAVWPPRGDQGFGYDPMFVPEGYDVTFGEMDPAEKHTISHRADAFRQLINACFERK